MSKLQSCVYVLQSLRDEQLYVGFTANLHARLTAHFHGDVSSTAPRRPFRLLYCEYHHSQSDARRREQYLKTIAGKRALRLILRDALTQSGCAPQYASPAVAPRLTAGRRSTNSTARPRPALSASDERHCGIENHPPTEVTLQHER